MWRCPETNGYVLGFPPTPRAPLGVVVVYLSPALEVQKQQFAPPSPPPLPPERVLVSTEIRLNRTLVCVLINFLVQKL